MDAPNTFAATAMPRKPMGCAAQAVWPQWCAAVPMGRGGEAMEVARAILWLLSDEASYTTGTFIDVSGGR